MQKITLTTCNSGVYSLDSSTGAVSQVIKDCNASRFGVSYIGNSTSYLAGFQANKSVLHIWSNKNDPIYRVSLPEIIKCCEFQDDGGIVYAGGLSGTIYIWVISTGQLLNCWLSHYKPINKIKLVQNNSILITCSEDCYIQAFLVNELLESNNSLTFPKPIMKWAAHSASINDFCQLGLTSSLSKLSIITVGGDFTLNLLTFRTEKPQASLNLSTQLFSCTSTDCGRFIFIGGGSGLVYKISHDQINDINLNVISKLVGHSGPVRNCIYSNGKIYSSATDGVRIWDMITGTCIAQLPQFGDWVSSIISTKVSMSYLASSLPSFKPFQKNITNSYSIIGLNIQIRDRRQEISCAIHQLSYGVDAMDYLSASFLSFSSYSQQRKQILKGEKRNDTLIFDHNNMIKLAIEKCIFLEMSQLRSCNKMHMNNLDFEYLTTSTPSYSKFSETTEVIRQEKKEEKQKNKNLCYKPKIQRKLVNGLRMSKLNKIVHIKRLLRKKLYR
ncbi:WD repeat protein [Cryptosporidium canis]|uniref:WD repeat protein n=1 Tax=Cryptosporidium canis TaxID=195482 RepID=A0A9D5DI45_9CRYT|nr:WD repeat protein [Cryptosporidium canis]